MAKDSIPKTSGIYKITCTANGKIYVGSSKDLRRRWWQHRNALSKNTHINRYLQNAWNKYGEIAFEFEIMELVMSWSIIDRENYWLDKLKPYDHKIGFNIGRKAESGMTGRSPSVETRLKLSIANKGRKQSPESIERAAAAHRGKHQSAEHIEKRAAKLRGVKKSPQHIEKIAAIHRGKIISQKQLEIMTNATSRNYVVTSPDGIETEVRNLSKFCREHDLNNKALSNVAYGYNSHHKGWKCRLAERGS